jgi:hypothetical protein
MEKVCSATGEKCNGAEADNMLFKCEYGVVFNRIYVKEECKINCISGGAGKSDYCEVA